MEKEKREERQEEIRETGSLDLNQEKSGHKIKLLTIIGEIEGHETVAGNTKATKYEHLLPMLAEVEDSREIDGVLILLNTLGGDVEAGLSIAEMIASLSKPTVSLVLGGSHSIGGNVLVDGQDVCSVLCQVIDDRGEHAGDILHGHIEGDNGVGAAGIVLHDMVLILVKGTAGDISQPHSFGGVCGFSCGDIFFSL